MTAGRPLVSVLMPVRNGMPFLPASLDSILAQTFDRFELLIIDDGSMDETPSVLKEYHAGDRRIRLLQSRGNGIVAALNHGISAAHGAYLARMDADDVALPERLARQVAFLDSHPEIAVVGTQARVIDRNGEIHGCTNMPTSPSAVRREIGFRSPVVHPTAMARTGVLRQIGGYRECCRHAEDYDLWLRISDIAEIANLPDELLLFRRHPGQVSRVRRLEQRAIAALARRLALERSQGLPESVGSGMEPMDAVHTFLRHWAPEALVDTGSRKDFTVMLRACGQKRRISLSQLPAFLPHLRQLGFGRSLAALSKFVAGV